MSTVGLRRGDLVEVRSAREILATLDDNASLEGLPFMPEMAAHCGERFRVRRRAERICDTITGEYGSRRLHDSVLLDDLRCDGAGHGGCQARCATFWKESWLRRVEHSPARNPAALDGHDELLARASAASVVPADGPTRYRCQATEAVAASERLSARDPTTYARELTTRNVPLGHFAVVMGRAVKVELLIRLGRAPEHPRGNSSVTPPAETLDLQPGEWVRVKSEAEIRGLLNDKGASRGLHFDREMLAFCGQTHRVLARVTKIIDEPTGTLMELNSDCIVLEDVICSGERSTYRWFCPRAIYPYWRESWLERVEPPLDSVVAVLPPTRT